MLRASSIGTSALPETPNALLVAKRLAQCLSMQMPTSSTTVIVDFYVSPCVQIQAEPGVKRQ